MIPKYALSQMDTEMLRQCVERTHEKVACAVLVWKGIRGEDKPKLLVALGALGLRTVRV